MTNEDDALLYQLALHQCIDVYTRRGSHFVVLAEQIRRGIKPAAEALLTAEREYRQHDYRVLSR
jgi:hypothetical protein